ncbi:proline-rich receptor-like protein kinase PERK1 [Drosophila persimilis]|uniref:proline-rich receptor-like protein kinase PERK1 n=1 Tax=Drosophila persimilis TaxID=7234 RepID=UPI000F09643A|nr:proline-rich receptor-like protein kinase PERK1 [Drosophila persimilis]XP_026842328.1 proline-rich receptor-like protein kinase PERK1 [Drosophila persimilis]XP_026842329.1 proline-rich receptor-like protein kinase PERK1 [Drosophila persimilis]
MDNPRTSDAQPLEAEDGTEGHPRDASPPSSRQPRSTTSQPQARHHSPTPQAEPGNTTQPGPSTGAIPRPPRPPGPSRRRARPEGPPSPRRATTMTWAWLNDVVHPNTSRNSLSRIITVEAMRPSDSDEEVRAGRAQQELPRRPRRRKHPGQGTGTAVTPRATRRRVEPGHVNLDPNSEGQSSSPVAHKLRLRSSPPPPYYLYRIGEPLTPRPNYDSSSDEGFTSPTMEADKHWEPTCQASTDEEFLHDRRFGKAGGRPWVKHSVRELNRQLEAERATTGPYSDVSEDEDGPANCQKNTPANIAVDVAPWTTWKDADRTLQLLLAHPRPITPPRPEREIIPASDNDTTSDDEVQLLGEDDTTPLRISDGSLGDALPRRLRNLGLQDEHETLTGKHA